MKSCLLSLLIFLGLMYFIGSLFANSTFSKIDSCLDSGGCWDDIRNRCEYKNQGMCVKNSEDCDKKWHGTWNDKEHFCVINKK